MKLNRQVNLIMPVFRGGQYWKSSLSSLASARSLFGEVVLSFDGPTRHELSLRLNAEFDCSLIDRVLLTPEPMKALDHIRWMVDQEPLASWGDEQLVTILAEDDLICTETLEQGLEAVRENEHSLLFGSWIEKTTNLDTFDGDCTNGNLIHIYSEREISRQLSRWVRGSEVTTISGMTFELKVLRQFLRLVFDSTRSETLLGGIRTEYFLATQPAVKSLIRCSEPITQIQIHDQQEGRIVAKSDRTQDETLYQLWLLITKQKMRYREKLVALLRVTKGVMKYPTVMRLLPNAWTTFRRASNAP